MRLGGYYGAEWAADLEAVCGELDLHGLSAIRAPDRIEGMSPDECATYGEEARRLGLVVGEAGMWENLMTSDPDLQTRRIERVRLILAKADLMGCACVVTLVGSGHPSGSMVAPDPVLMGAEGQSRFREVVHRILDGLDLVHTNYGVEPWPNTFFYQPEDIAAFLDDVGHPRLRLHLDLVNMVSRDSFFDTSGLVERTFGLLGDRIAAVHLKDLRWDHDHYVLKWDEVPIGEGVVDYHAYLSSLATLPADTPCYCEHLAGESEYATSFARLHALATEAGTQFLPRLQG